MWIIYKIYYLHCVCIDIKISIRNVDTEGDNKNIFAAQSRSIKYNYN